MARYEVTFESGYGWREIHKCDQRPTLELATVSRNVLPNGTWQEWKLSLFRDDVTIRCCPFCGARLHSRRKPDDPWTEERQQEAVP